MKQIKQFLINLALGVAVVGLVIVFLPWIISGGR